ncbi:MAG: inositol monophosphatase family protein [Pseudomonadota bacterium]
MPHPAINIATEAAHAAGEIMRRSLRRLDTVPVARKARHDYVSEVDRACEAAIVKEIRRFNPDHAILGEEGGQQGEGEVLWVVDPLDGTSNYLHGIPHFAVSIAYKVRGRTEHGVIYDPLRDELFTTSRGVGAFLNSQRIRVSERKQLDTAILATAFPFRERHSMPLYTKVFSAVYRKVEDIRRTGSAALDLAWTAAGRFDGYFELGLKPWDVAAGALLVREAGGVVSDFAGEDDFERTGSVLAAPYKLTTPLRQLISPHWPVQKA